MVQLYFYIFLSGNSFKNNCYSRVAAYTSF